MQSLWVTTTMWMELREFRALVRVHTVSKQIIDAPDRLYVSTCAVTK